MRPFVMGGEAKDGQDLYDLYGVVHHIGGMNGGHYVSNCHVVDASDGSLNTGSWYEFNDMHVRQVSEADVVKQSGYLLFYRRREMSPHNIINLSY